MKCVLCGLLCLVGWIFFQPPSRSEGAKATPPQQEEIGALLKRIGALRATKNLAGLRQLVTEAKTEWLLAKGGEYYPVILELCLALNSTTRPELYEAMRDLAVSVIDSPREKPPEITGRLLLLLQGDPEYSRGQLRGEKWGKERHTRTERWLRVWKLIREHLAALPEPAGPRYLHVSPPPETGLPDGVAPSAVKDPVLRKRFEDAIEKNTRNWEAYREKSDLAEFEKHFASGAKRQLIEAYSKPPFQTDELEKSLEEAGLDKDVRSAILDEVKKRVAARTEQQAKLPNTAPRMQITEPAPPGTATHHADPRLRVKVSFDLKAPRVDEVLDELRKVTGVELSRADDIQNQYPAVGSFSYRNVPAWHVMDDLARSKRVEGRWETEGSGYRLIRNGNPVVISEEVTARPWLLVIGVGGSLLAVAGGLLYWFRRRRRSPAAQAGR